MTTGLSFLRQKIGLSQQELAEYLSVSRSTLAMAETGRAHLNPAAVQRYGVAWDELRKALKTVGENGPSVPAPSGRVEKEKASLRKQIQKIETQLQKETEAIGTPSVHKAWFEKLRARPEMAEWDLDTWCKAQEIRIRKPTKAETTDRFRFLSLKREILQRQLAFWEENSA